MPARRCFFFSATAALAVLLSAPATAPAQRSGSDDEAIQEKVLETKDGVKLGVTYYRSSAGRDATPVIMLHDLKASRAVYRGFAERLQSPGRGSSHPSFAVVTVDFRGHGDSTEQAFRGRTRQLDASNLRKADYDAMVLGDLEAVRKLLVTENDEGRLNLNRLSIVATGFGCSVAMNYTARDWTMPPLAATKQGQDVKALALVSPRWKSSGLSLQKPLKVPALQRSISYLMLYGGGDRKVAADATRIFRQLERGHRGALMVPEKTKPPETLPTLTAFGPDTELQGQNWLQKAGSAGEDLIIRFLTQHAAEPDFDYVKRRKL
ncbi:MAG: alpha/beta hydrolase [Planctomycetota bacterium]